MSSGDNITFPDAGESAADLEFERTLLVGSFLGCLAYGLHLAVYAAAVYFSLFKSRQRRTLLLWWFIAYMTVIFAMSTTYIAANIQANIDMYINHRDFPGGPLVYTVTTFSVPYVLVGNNICPNISIFFTDALLVWRLYIIWGAIWIAVFPVIILLASTVMGILLIYTSALPGNTFDSAVAVQFGTAYFSISLSLTVLVTLLIVGRLMYIQRQVAKVLGNSVEYREHYVSASSVLVESSALYSVFGFTFLILYNRNSPVANIFSQLLVQVMCISSDLIILRVAMGTAWTSKSSEKVSSLLYNHPDSDTHVGDVESLGRMEAKPESRTESKPESKPEIT